MVGEVRRGLAGVLHTHGFEIEDCLITVRPSVQSTGRQPARLQRRPARRLEPAGCVRWSRGHHLQLHA